MSTLPRNFSWIESSVLAGCGRPESVAELEAAKREGVGAIVSLTGTPLSPEVIDRLGFAYLHSPLSAIPSIQQLTQIIQFIESQKSQSHPVLVHCGEGIGRTGTVLAAYLVYHGMRADDAIRVVREKRSGSIQTVEQENIVREFEKVVSSEKH
ncbi:MAG: dual specificity protein phosphatase family protein [Candidatus Bathyarchaeia archaeon]